MVTGQYPPLQGGVGRYTKNLVDALKKQIDVVVATDKNASETLDVFCVLSRASPDNSEEILKLEKKVRPDIIHIQYESSLFETRFSTKNFFQFFDKSALHKFYTSTKTPVLTTIHGVIPQEEYDNYYENYFSWKGGKLGFLPKRLKKQFRYKIVDQIFSRFEEIANLSDEIINLASFSQKVMGKGKTIYIGAEPAPDLNFNKTKFREELGLPKESKLLLVLGHLGSDSFNIFDDVVLPQSWLMVIKNNKKLGNTRNDMVEFSKGYLDEKELSKLFFACDAVLIPRKIVSTTGVLYDAIAHGLPFIGSNFAFFKEFANMGLGIVSEGDSASFSDAINQLSIHLHEYKENVEKFRYQLRWENITKQHLEVYSEVIKKYRKIN